MTTAIHWGDKITRMLAYAFCVLPIPVVAYADRIAFLVPTQIIYPGEIIGGSGLHEKHFTIRASAAGQYVLSPQQLIGKVARRTLLPGQPILVSALNEPDLVERGVPVALVYNTGALVITAKGTPLEAGHAGDFIKVRNMDSGIIVSGTVLADGSIQVGMR
ncbi:flagella basal body P-ring formation protein FlgA [Phyllobacterium endophyticum]|uniref:Flagella basal body P-ring formation protein FlgA n=2 Tax=Phyllobacterium endophyticum TaxID=1149773 RepID=A0A2P7AP03_9HYPH|nr:flagella basal body P-ring formation protein FlgA [Phyllobacterium endophyticum]PSH55935.1 flagella basal body P-ring formation protein FlgA [Phyllobacterium endophyticum]TYR41079.1 flagellar basal body P-ring formation protein FlgA [Phyllobacterium endophyticum]